MPLDVELHRDPTSFDLPCWRKLLGSDPDRHIFATPEWQRLWWEEFGAGKELFVLTMRRAGEVVAIVPLYRKLEGATRTLRFVGGIDLTDYVGPICAPEDREAVAESLLHWLSRAEVHWDLLDAHNMPVPFGFAEFLVDHSDRLGFEFSLEQEETSAVLPLASGWETYLSSLASKERHELRRKRRRLARDHPGARVRASDATSLGGDMKLFVDMHRGADGHKGHFMRPEVATFFERLARDLSKLGWLRLDLLEIDGRPVAATFGFELEGVFYLYNSAYEPEAARLSPGLILAAALVERSIALGLRAFDFLRGPERYKYQLGSQAMPLNNVRVLNKGAVA